MSTPGVPRVEIDGRRATIEQIWIADLSGEGHFTAMQVRDRATLGLDFHLVRLDAATQELFGVGMDGDRIRDCIRHALADDITDASVRVNVFRGQGADDVSVMVSVRPPAPMPVQAQLLQPLEYRRPLAHLKRTGGFGQSYYGSVAHANGFHEALFVGSDGLVSEGSITNIGFLDGDSVVWPDAPALQGVMMQVVQRALDDAGLAWRSEAVRISDLATFEGAFVTNAHGIATVAQIGDLSLPTDTVLMDRVSALLAEARHDPI